MLDGDGYVRTLAAGAHTKAKEAYRCRPESGPGRRGCGSRNVKTSGRLCALIECRWAAGARHGNNERERNRNSDTDRNFGLRTPRPRGPSVVTTHCARGGCCCLSERTRPREIDIKFVLVRVTDLSSADVLKGDVLPPRRRRTPSALLPPAHMASTLATDARWLRA